MKRTTMQHLERLAWDNHRLIEYDHAAGIAVLKLGRVTWYASLPPVTEAAP